MRWGGAGQGAVFGEAGWTSTRVGPSGRGNGNGDIGFVGYPRLNDNGPAQIDIASFGDSHTVWWGGGRVDVLKCEKWWGRRPEAELEKMNALL